MQGSTFPPDESLDLMRLVAERALLGALRAHDSAASADAARRRAEYLAECSLRLGASVDVGRTLETIAQIALADFGAWCIVDVLGKRGAVSRYATMHPDPTLRHAATGLAMRWAPSPDESFGVPAVLRDHATVTITATTADHLVRATPDEEVRRMVYTLGTGPLLVVAMTSAGELYGALTYVRTSDVDTYSPEEIRLAEGIAQRCGHALGAAHREESSALFRALAERSPEIVSIFDLKGCFTYVSPSVERLLGHAVSELVGNDALELIHPDDRETLTRKVMVLAKRGADAAGEVTTRVQHKDESWRSIEIFMQNLLHDPAVRGFTGTARDISARSDAEAQARQLEKMEAVGRLAGGVAQDFNNLLTVISAHSSLLSESLADGEERDGVRAIELAASRGARLTRQLLAFSRKQILQPVALDLNEAIRAARRSVALLIGPGIELVVDPGAGQPFVFADPVQVEQLLANLSLNAHRAMRPGGRLTISTRIITLLSVLRDPRRPVPRAAMRCCRSATPATGWMTRSWRISSSRSSPRGRRVKARASASRPYTASWSSRRDTSPCTVCRTWGPRSASICRCSIPAMRGCERARRPPAPWRAKRCCSSKTRPRSGSSRAGSLCGADTPCSRQPTATKRSR
jgi:PAS domain S-box-containing protein